jgi:hypothetical protein
MCATETGFLKSLTSSDILHFSGPGCSEGITLENETGYFSPHLSQSLQYMPCDLQQLQPCQKLPLLVFLAANHSESMGHAFVEAGVRHVIVIDKRYIRPANTHNLFVGMFYRELFSGKSVFDAFTIAKVNFKCSYR